LVHIQTTDSVLYNDRGSLADISRSVQNAGRFEIPMKIAALEDKECGTGRERMVGDTGIEPVASSV
jgi:hypothetical protein